MPSPIHIKLEDHVKGSTCEFKKHGQISPRFDKSFLPLLAASSLATSLQIDAKTPRSGPPLLSHKFPPLFLAMMIRDFLYKS